MRYPRVPLLIPEDVQSLNRIFDPDQQGCRAVVMFHPDKMAEEQFKVELMPQKQQLQLKADHSACRPTSG